MSPSLLSRLKIKILYLSGYFYVTHRLNFSYFSLSTTQKSLDGFIKEKFILKMMDLLNVEYEFFTIAVESKTGDLVS